MLFKKQFFYGQKAASTQEVMDFFYLLKKSKELQEASSETVFRSIQVR